MTTKHSKTGYTARSGKGHHTADRGAGAKCNGFLRVCNGFLSLITGIRGLGRVTLANEAPEEAVLANEGMVVDADELVVPFGDHKLLRKEGGRIVTYVQRLDQATGEKMVAHFNSLRSRLARRFGGLPIYIGHPDAQGMEAEYPDTKAYGWIEGMSVGETGLVLKPKWSAAGSELLANAHYKYFSPAFNVLKDEVTEERGVKIARPYGLQSVGLTNKPNIPVLPLVNEEPVIEQPKENEMNLLQRLLALVGLETVKTEDDVVSFVSQAVAALKKIKEATDARWKAEDAARMALPNEAPAEDRLIALLGGLDESATLLANEVQTRQRVETDLADVKAKCTAAEEALKTSRRGHAELLFANAAREGRVTPAQKDGWIGKFDQDFDGTVTLLANEKKKVKTSSVVTDLGKRNSTEADRRGKILELVNARMASTGEDYTTAFVAVEKDSNNAALFQEQPAQ